MLHAAGPQTITERAASVGDLEDLPVLHTAYATGAGAEDVGEILAAARADGGWFLVSEITRDFPPGRNTHGWGFITAHEFLRVLQRRGDLPA